MMQPTAAATPGQTWSMIIGKCNISYARQLHILQSMTSHLSRVSNKMKISHLTCPAATPIVIAPADHLIPGIQDAEVVSIDFYIQQSETTGRRASIPRTGVTGATEEDVYI